jgi:hypothetical protein
VKEEVGLLGDLSSIIDAMKSLSCDRGNNIEQLTQAHYDEIEQMKRTHAYEKAKMSAEYGKMLRDCTDDNAVSSLDL